MTATDMIVLAGVALPPYLLQVLCLAGINITLAVSLNLINGFTGQFSIGHAGFMAIGAYSSAYFTVTFGAENLGDLKTELVSHFFRSVSENGRFNLHLLQLAGTNSHHLCEASFKAFARAFAQAKAHTGDAEVPSTKGLLE